MATPIGARSLRGVNVAPEQLGLWYVRDKPLPDELLSSWITRLAWNHGLKYQNFCFLNWGRSSVAEHGDIDRRAPEAVLATLRARTGATEAQVRQTTLQSLVGVLFESLATRGHVSGLYSRSVRTGGRVVHFRYQYCAACLRADEHPYVRKVWRLSLFVCCARHAELLQDRCANCRAPYVPSRFAKGYRGRVSERNHPITHCWYCRTDLSALGGRRAGADEMRFVALVHRGIAHGWVQLKDQLIHAMSYVEGVRVLTLLLTRARRGEHLVAQFERVGLLLPRDDVARLDFDRLDVVSRRSVVRALEVLLCEWPSNYVAWLQAAGISSSYVNDIRRESLLSHSG